MEFVKTDIAGAFIVKPRVFEDSRGYFFESFSERDFAAAGIDIHFVQENESKSRRGVVRGLHFQKAPFAQAKLVSCAKGKVVDVCVDIRPDSPSFGKHICVELTPENHLSLFIPKGCAHGFAVLSDEAVLRYKCDEFYHPESEGSIAWNDPDLAVAWPVAASEAIISEKDARAASFKEYLKTIGR